MFPNQDKKILAQLKAAWGKPKSRYFYYAHIDAFFKEKSKKAEREQATSSFQLNEQTQKDLDFTALFEYVDRTQSYIGQQYLYNRLLHPNSKDLGELEQQIQYYIEEEDHRWNTQKILKQLSTENDYHFPYLIYGELPPKMDKYWVVHLLRFLLVASLFVIVVFPPFIFVLIATLMFNVFLHYWHKKRVDNFSHIFPRITRLANVTEELLPYSFSDESTKHQLKTTSQQVKKMLAKVIYLKTDTYKDNEITAAVWYLFELSKIITLGEITTFHSIVDEIEASRSEIEKLYFFIGKTDLALSVGSLRAGLPYFSTPNFIRGAKSINFEELYHPLVENCVPNTLQLNQQSLLLTGSNMSGKSTFIKAININALVSQSLNTSFTKKYNAPVYALASSIKIADDLLDQKSYYMEEVFSIGHLMTLSEQSEQAYLFTIDEVFKGTNTVERISAAKAILAYLNRGPHLILVSTHDIELTELLNESYALHYFQESIENEALSFDYKLRKGALQKRNAIKILEISGYPNEVIQDAERVASQLVEMKGRRGNR